MLNKVIEFLLSFIEEHWIWLLLVTIILLITLIYQRKMFSIYFRKYKWEILVFSISIFFFGAIIINQSWVDIQLHCYGLSEYLDKGLFPGYPLYFFMVYALSGFQNNSTLFIISSGILLSSIFTLKYYAIKQYLQVKKVFSSEHIVFFLCFIGVIFYSAKEQYIGKYSLTCFHNSTSIPLLPISIFMLIYTIQYLENESNLSLSIKLIVLSILSMLVKPSFMMIYLPVLFLFIITTQHKKIFNSTLIFIPCMLILALEYFFIFSSEQGTIVDPELKNSIALGWLDVWNQNSPSFFQKAIDVLMPIIFPIIYLVYTPQLRKHLELKFLFCMYIFSFFLANVIYEDGNRMLDGNFMWHLHLINVLLFLYCARDWLVNRLSFSSFTNKLFFTIILIHVIFGFLAMYNFISFGMRYDQWSDVQKVIHSIF